MGVATDSASVSVSALEDLMREGARALIDRLGYANAARFIAILGGEGDSVMDIRERRVKSDIDEITERIKRRRADQRMLEKRKEDYYKDV
jgi:aspartate/methionine/tyrosine aminotransferase